MNYLRGVGLKARNNRLGYVLGDINRSINQVLKTFD